MDSKIPANFERGDAKGDGDCFYDSIAQSLKQFRPEWKHDIGSLRALCAEFAETEIWVKDKLEQENILSDRNASNIRYCAGECPPEMSGPIWGRTHIEGRIICTILNVKIHLIEKQSVTNEDVWIDEVIDANGFQQVGNFDYQLEEMIHIINMGKGHFDPVLRKNVEEVTRNQEIVAPTEQINLEALDNKPNDPTSRRDAGAAQGHIYEVKLLMLFLLRGLTKTTQFRITKNVAKIGNLDDIVFKYRNARDVDAKFTTVFIQTTHRDDNEQDKITLAQLTSMKGKFSVASYFSAYKKIKERFSTFNDGPCKGNFQDCHFVIYTNNLLHSDVENDESILKTNWGETDIGQMLHSSEKCIVQLKYTDDLARNICKTVGLKQLAQEIFNYTLGENKGTAIMTSNNIIFPYHIPLANQVFDVKRSNQTQSKLQTSFVHGKDTSVAKELWGEMFNIAKRSDMTEIAFRQQLEEAEMKFFKSFGNLTLKLNNMPNLVERLAKIINESTAKQIEISKDMLPGEINNLANNVLIMDDRANDGKEWVRFKESNLTKKANEFMDILKTKIANKNQHLREYSFSISGFPTLSLPKLDDKDNIKEAREFLKQFHIFAGQSYQSKLDDIIKEEMESTYVKKKNPDLNSDMNPNLDYDVIFSIIEPKILQWWLNRETDGLTEKNDYFEQAISYLNINFFCQKNKMDIKKTTILFEDKRITELAGLIEHHQVLNIVTEKGATLLSKIQVFQVLDKNRENIYLTLQQLICIERHIPEIFNKKGILAIEGNWRTEHITILQNMSSVMQRSNNKKVIFITEQDQLGNIFEDHLNVPKHIVRDKYELKDFTSETRTMILEKIVTFQGKPTKLGNLLDMDHCATFPISSQMVMQLITDENIIISHEPLRLNDLEAAYAKMYTEIPGKDVTNILLKSLDRTSLFLVCGISKPVVGTVEEELLNRLSIPDTQIADRIREKINCNEITIFPNQNQGAMLDKFKQLCAVETSRIVYLIELISGKFYLQQLFDPHFYTKRTFNYPGKVRIGIDILLQRNLSDTYIFQCTSGKQRVLEMIDKRANYFLEQFEIQCQNNRILFVTFETEAENRFQKLCETNDSVHWLKLDDVNPGNFILHRSHGPLCRLNAEESNVEPDILITEKLSGAIFIVSNNADKQTVKTILENFAVKRRNCFENNCKNAIHFASKSRNEKSILSKIRKDRPGPVHWLTIHECDANNFIWLRSNGSLDKLRYYVNIDYEVLDEEKFYKNVKSKCVIIADDPGMGKSTTLASLSEQTRETNWVIRIDFRDCTDAINDLPSKQQDMDYEAICDFFSQVQNTGIQCDLAKQLLLHKLKQNTCETNPILILLDAFDEINDDQQTKVTPLLKLLKDQSSAEVWITARKTRTQELENTLGLFATGFKELDENQQLEFLYAYWTVRLNVLQKPNVKDNLREYARILLGSFTRSLEDTILKLMGIPLQLRLLAEGFQNDVENNAQPKSDGITLLSMYKRFIDVRYNIYFREKTRLDENSPYIKNRLSKAFNKDHRYLAFHVLFPEQTVLNYKDRFPKKEEERDLMSVGIIQSFGSAGNTYFIHRTFAEYFTADLLVGNLEYSGNVQESTIQFLSREMFETGNIVVRRFIEQMLAKNSPMHMAALESNIAKLVEIQYENNSEIMVDKLGRTALHLACQDSHLNIVKVLLDNGYDALKADVFGKTPLHYAAMNRNADIIKHLTNYVADINIYDNIFGSDMPSDIEIGNTIFQQPKYLSSNLVQLVNHCDYDHKSSIHYAAAKQDWNTACTLILNGADISCLNDYATMQILFYTLQQFSLHRSDPDDKLLPVIALLLMKFPHYLNSKDILNVYYNDIMHHFSVHGPEAVFLSVLKATKDTNRGNAFSGLRSGSGNRVTLHRTTISETDKVRCMIRAESDSEQHYERASQRKVQNIINTDRHEILKWGHALNERELILANKILDTGNLSLLHSAASMTTPFFTWYLIEAGADVNNKDKDGRTPLYYAALDSLKYNSPKNSIRMVIFLLTKGAIYDSKDGQNKTVLEHCIENGVGKEILKCLKNVGDVFQDVSRVIPLFDRMSRKMYNAIAHAKNTNEDTLLHLAASQRAIKELDFILRNTKYNDIKHINAKNKQGNTPLHLAAQTGCIEIVKLLLSKNGLIFNSENSENHTPKQIAEANNYVDIVALLHEIGNLFNAITTNHVQVFQDTIQKYSCRHIRDRDGKTLVHWAVEYGQTDMAKYLLEPKYFFDINATDFNGCTALHCAAENRQTTLVHLLLKCGAEYNPLNKEGKTPMDLADQIISNLLRSIHNIFKDLKMNIMLMVMNSLKSVQASNIEYLSALFNSRDDEGNTLLHLAAKAYNFEIVSYLLQNGAPYNATNNNRLSPEDLTANKKIETLFKFIKNMMDCGAKIIYGLNEEEMYKTFVNVRSVDGRTVFHSTAIYSHRVINYYRLKRYIQYGANINAEDNSGKTVLDVAIDRKKLDLVKFLLMKGVNVSNLAEDRFERLKRTAEQEGRPDIVSLIQSMWTAAKKSVKNVL